MSDGTPHGKPLLPYEGWSPVGCAQILVVLQLFLYGTVAAIALWLAYRLLSDGAELYRSWPWVALGLAGVPGFLAGVLAPLTAEAWTDYRSHVINLVRFGDIRLFLTQPAELGGTLRGRLDATEGRMAGGELMLELICSHNRYERKSDGAYDWRVRDLHVVSGRSEVTTANASIELPIPPDFPASSSAFSTDLVSNYEPDTDYYRWQLRVRGSEGRATMTRTYNIPVQPLDFAVPHFDARRLPTATHRIRVAAERKLRRWGPILITATVAAVATAWTAKQHF